jgi:hypothetical protein
VKNAFLLIAHDMQRLDWQATDGALLTPAGSEHVQTMQISPGAAFFPRLRTIEIIIAFEQEWRHWLAQRRGY